MMEEHEDDGLNLGRDSIIALVVLCAGIWLSRVSRFLGFDDQVSTGFLFALAGTFLAAHYLRSTLFGRK